MTDPTSTTEEETTMTSTTTESTDPSGGEAPVEQPPAPDATEEDPTTQEPAEDEDNPNAEAAKYRRRLRDAEAEQERLRARVAELEGDAEQTSLADTRASVAAEHGIPDELAEELLADAADEDGIRARAEQLGKLVAAVSPPAFAESAGQGQNNGGAGRSEPTWGGLLRSGKQAR